jgi:hypothetical protein
MFLDLRGIQNCGKGELMPTEWSGSNVDDSETAESNDEDVEFALSRETDDGKGGAVVPKENFRSFATDGVENDEGA